MKKLLLFSSLLVFIFSNISFGQIEPRLTEKVTELYIGSQETYLKTNHKFFNYRDNGDTLSIIEKRFELRSGDLMLWLADFYEYDDENRLIKKINKRYNQEVDLWISNYWEDYFYDEDGCIEREELTYNVGGLQETFFFSTDGNCRKVEARETDQTDFNIYETYSYPDENNSLIVSRNELYQGVWNEVWQYDWIRNDRGDLVKTARLFKSDFAPTNDTAYYSLQVYEYDYEEDFFTGRVTSKFKSIITIKTIYFILLSIILNYDRKVDLIINIIVMDYFLKRRLVSLESPNHYLGYHIFMKGIMIALILNKI